ncbi:MAG: portal protein, partial [Pseudomonadota bacterium]
GFGTAAALVYPDFDTVIRVHPMTIGEYWLGVDHRGRVNELFYRSSMTVEQIVSEFFDGDVNSERMPLDLQSPARNGAFTTRFNVLCYVGPNEDGSGGPGQRDKPYVSEYWLERGHNNLALSKQDADDSGWLARRGFSYNPILAVRWQKLGRDAYGRGCGHNALGDCAMLQDLTRHMLRAVQYQVSPPLQGPPWQDDANKDLRPGAYNPLIGERQVITSMWEVRLDLQQLRELILETRDRIQQTFYNDVLSTFLARQTVDSTRITATEAVELSQEKLTLFAPIAMRFVDELLIPLNEAAIAIMASVDMFEEDGMVGAPPDSITGRDMDFEFTGILAQAQRLVQGGQIERFLSFVAGNAEVFPEMLDRVDPDDVVDEYADIVGAHAKLLVDKDEAKAARAARAERQQMAQAAEMARAGAGAARDLAAAPVDDGNALGALIGGGQGGGVT